MFTLTDLPIEVLIHILKKLKLQDVRNLMRTCNTIKEIIINDNALWKWICRNDLVVRNPVDNLKPMPFCWYHQCRISHNWRKGIYRDRIVLYHRENFMPWLNYVNSEALVLSVGSQLLCYSTDNKGIPYSKNLQWKVEVPKVQRYDVRTNDISRFIIKGNIIACGNRDGSAVVLEFDHIKRRPKVFYFLEDCIENGQVEVSAVELLNSKSQPCLVTASCNSKCIVFWSKPENITADEDCYTSAKLDGSVKTIQNALGVKCLSGNISENKLAIGPNGNSKPILLDLTTGFAVNSIDSVQNDKLAVRDIKWHNENTVIYVTHSGRLQFIDIRTGNVIYSVMDPFQSTLYCLKSDGDRAIMVGSSEYSRCVLFDTRKSSAHVQMYFTQKKSSPIYSLDFDTTKLIAAADRSVAALNFNVNVNSAQIRDYSQTFEIITDSAA